MDVDSIYCNYGLNYNSGRYFKKFVIQDRRTNVKYDILLNSWNDNYNPVPKESSPATLHTVIINPGTSGNPEKPPTKGATEFKYIKLGVDERDEYAYVTLTWKPATCLDKKNGYYMIKYSYNDCEDSYSGTPKISPDSQSYTLMD